MEKVQALIPRLREKSASFEASAEEAREDDDVGSACDIAMSIAYTEIADELEEIMNGK